MTSSHAAPGSPERRGPARSRYVRVVLLGFMASGKTAVGRALAGRLGWRHIDLDQEIERHAGLTVEEIFASEGESAFRDLEIRLTPRFAEQTEVVLSPGGGWVTNPGLFDSLAPDTLTVWLKVSPRAVLERVGRSPGQAVRPLLAGPDAAGRVESLLSRREASYARAAVQIDTENASIDEIVQKLIDILEAGPAPGMEATP